MVIVVIILAVIIMAVSAYLEKLNWAVVLPIIAALGVAIYFLKRRKKKEMTISYSSSAEPIDVNAPVELTGAYKCQACGGVTQIHKDDTQYVCRYCGAELLEAEKDAEQIRRERRWENVDRQKQRENEQQIILKNMELEQEKIKADAQKRKTRNSVLAIVIPVMVTALIILLCYFIIHGFFEGLFGSLW